MEIFGFIIYVVLVLVIANAGDKRNVGFWIPFVISLFLTPIIGFIVVILSPVKQKQNESYLQYQKLAELAEYKGDINSAIDNYLNCLFHLEKDNPKEQWIGKIYKPKLIEELKLKVETLKKNISAPEETSKA